jgi:hypothetical protein
MKITNRAHVSLVAALSTLALTAPAASAALPNLLPTTVGFSSESGASEFGTGIIAIKSAKSKGAGKGSGEKTASFSVVLEGWKDNLGRTCKGLGDTIAGNVTATGTADVRYKNAKKEAVVLAELLEPVHIECGTLLMIVKGCLAGEMEKPYNKLVTAVVVKYEVEKADNKIVKIENGANTAEEPCELRVSFNESEGGELASESRTEKLQSFTGGKGAGSNEAEVMA